MAFKHFRPCLHKPAIFKKLRIFWCRDYLKYLRLIYTMHLCQKSFRILLVFPNLRGASESTYRGRVEIGGVGCFCPIGWSVHHNVIQYMMLDIVNGGWACTPTPAPAWANFSITKMYATKCPCHSAYSAWGCLVYVEVLYRLWCTQSVPEHPLSHINWDGIFIL